MKIFAWIIVAFIAVAAAVYVLIPTALSYHDAATRDRLLGMVSYELPPDASLKEMDQFMKRHTVRYALDGGETFEYVGFVKQSSFDRILADRQVQLILKIDRNTKTFDAAEVRVYYTFL